MENYISIDNTSLFVSLPDEILAIIFTFLNKYVIKTTKLYRKYEYLSKTLTFFRVIKNIYYRREKIFKIYDKFSYIPSGKLDYQYRIFQYFSETPKLPRKGEHGYKRYILEFVHTTRRLTTSVNYKYPAHMYEIAKFCEDQGLIITSNLKTEEEKYFSSLTNFWSKPEIRKIHIRK